MAASVQHRVYVLSKKIAALRISEVGSALFSELPKGAELKFELQTPGSNDAMVNVRCNDQLYRVFIHDIECNT
jgi:hypothetical protein